MFKASLTALEHPSAPSSLDFNDRKIFASTVIWLEDMKIRHLKINNRAALRKIDKLKEWEEEYKKYKIALEMPTFTKSGEEMAWMLSNAVRLEYLDSTEKYKEINSANIDKKSKENNVPNMKSKNIFDNVDSNQPDFEQGVRLLVNQLGFVNHSNHEVLLEAAAILIHKYKETFLGKRNKITGTPLSLDEKFTASKDRSLDLAVRIMRFNQLYKLRDLQTKINETLVAVQNVTADPKTDTKLGKVGF